MIPLAVPQIEGAAWEYVRQCLDTNWVSSVGGFVDRFERMLADYVGASHAVATVNGTAALHTALLVAGVERDDEVAVSTLTFIASANAARYVGAWAVPIDAESAYWQMDPQRLDDFLRRHCDWRDGRLINRVTGRRVAAVVPVHVLGHPVDMDAVLSVAGRFELPVIEDAAESLGAAYRGRRVGGLADIACFSFNGNKTITTGGGGMLVTNRREWADRARYLTTQAKDDPVEYVHGALGYNYRLTNLQAALGCAQMERLEAFVDRKRAIAAEYSSSLSGLPGVTLMPSAAWATSVFWLYTILIDASRYGMSSRALMRQLGRLGIQSRPLWQPMHQSRVHCSPASPACPVAEQLNRDALSLPSSVGLEPVQQRRVCAAITGLAAGMPPRELAAAVADAA